MVLLALTAAALGLAQSGEITGTVADATGAAIAGARIRVSRADSSEATEVVSSEAGMFRIGGLADGRYQLRATFEGFAPETTTGLIIEAPLRGAHAAIILRPAAMTDQVAVSARLIPGATEQAARIPGSFDVVDATLFQASRPSTFEEVLRKAPGVYARPEEGFGLRPNIGIRGLNPARSSRVLLLEDGVPLSYAPYGDNASYYHPPVDRYESVEVVKGAGQILYGPMTVGGVINYVTPTIPGGREGLLALTGGNRDYLNGHMRYGGLFGRTGLLFDFVRKQGEGSRDHTSSELNDFNFKLLTPAGARQTISIRSNLYTEDSNVTYSGLRLSEYLENPRQNPFRNDFFTGRRFGAALTHSMIFTPAAVLTTHVYGSTFSRDWWRQSSNSAQRPNMAANPVCGGMANLLTTCGNEGRLRDYATWGVEPRLRLSSRMIDTDLGGRVHVEVQERLQENGLMPTARSGARVENNRRDNTAVSGFIQNRLRWRSLTVTPGLRVEHVRYRRLNRLFNGGAGIAGRTQLTQAIPGLGVAWNPAKAITLFAGAHRGFAPPRTEDIINNSGGFVELDPELSWNYEAGMRARLARTASVEATWFRLDYQNQIIPASLAGGVGAALTSAGRTLNQGLETAFRGETRSLARLGGSFWVRTAVTWIPVARFEGRRLSSVPGFGGVTVSGNRLPYASRSLVNATLGYNHRRGANAQIEAVQTSRQFGDDLNTINPSPDGQRGALPGYTLWNATVNVPIEAWRTTLFITSKNLFDRTVLVDRARGMLPGSPRLVQAGLRFTF